MQKVQPILYYSGLLLLLISIAISVILYDALPLYLNDGVNWYYEVTFISSIVIILISLFIKGDKHLGITFFSKYGAFINKISNIIIIVFFILKIFAEFNDFFQPFENYFNLGLIFGLVCLLINSRETYFSNEKGESDAV